MFGLNFKTVLVAAFSMTVMGEFIAWLPLKSNRADIFRRHHLHHAVQAQDCTRNATVQAGDTCDMICTCLPFLLPLLLTIPLTRTLTRLAKKYASPTFQFALANPSIDADCSNLMIGDDVCLGQRGTDCSKVHVVVNGE